MSMPVLSEADPGVEDLSSHWQDATPSNHLVWSLCAIAALAVIWIVFVRMRKKKHKRTHRRHSWDPESGQRRRPHRRRRSSREARRTELPMNPTLAEVGGLPPVRPAETKDASESSPSP
jgi:hypothetical protein